MTFSDFDLRSELAKRSNPLQAFGFTVLLAYLFVINSRILDMLAPWLHLPMIMAVAMYATALVLGGVQRTLSSKSGVAYLLMTGWMCLSILVTTWKGNSLKTFTDIWLKSAPLYLAILATIYTTRQVQRVSNFIAFALTITCIIALRKGDVMNDGRLIIRATKFGDPNDLALFCSMALMSWLSLWNRTSGWLTKIPMAGAMAVILVTLLKTGSRGGLLGLFVVLTYIFFRSTLAQRVLLIAGLGVGTLLLGVLAGRQAADRLMTFFNNSEADTYVEAGAVGSTESRMYLLKKSIELTVSNPLLGVGIGNFMFAENVVAQGDGRTHGAWHQTHNMYTQVSSELGLPGLLLYLAIMWFTWRSLGRAEKMARAHPEAANVARTAFWMKATFLAYASSGTFLSVAYQDILPLLAGLALTLERAVAAEIFLANKAKNEAQGLRPQVPAPPSPWRRRPVYALNRVSNEV